MSFIFKFFGIFSKQTAIYRKPLAIIKNETTQQRVLRLTGFDVYQYPFCKKGQMKTIEIILRIRSPVKFFYPKN